MLHNRLIELEAEIRAKEKVEQGLKKVPVEALSLLAFIEKSYEARLGDLVPADWRGWLAYQRTPGTLTICRGRAFKHSNWGSKSRAGFDVPHGADAVDEKLRGFDAVPPQDLDHLLVNFGDEDQPKVYLWYGENIAPYRLIFQAQVDDEPHHDLQNACIDACFWIANRPKHLSLPEYLKKLASS